MPATDALQPPLTPAEREIRRSYGGWTNFMQSMGLKPYDQSDIAEGHAIISAMARADSMGDHTSTGNRTGEGSGKKN